MSDLWSSIAAAQEPVVAQSRALESLRAAVVCEPKRRTPQWAWWSLALVPALGAVLWLALPRFDQKTSFHADGNSGAVGMMLFAANKPLPVRFADGSSVMLATGAQAKVAQLGQDGAEIVLTAGSLQAHVIHAERTRWTFRAGQFEILVTGTKFCATWDPLLGALEVAMSEGSVRVSGGGLNQAMQLRTGETLRATSSGHVVTNNPGSPTPTPSVPVATAVDVPSVASSDEERRGPLPPPSPVITPWRTLAAGGKHNQALAAAQRHGLQRLLRSLPASDLLLLADTARYAQRPNVAANVFTTLVKRFPEAPEATDAAFALGRLAYAQEQWSQSARWFTDVVTRAPAGTLAAAAWGRLMESQERAADLVNARRSAKRYLELYPRGPQRSLAERLSRGESTGL